MFSVGIGFMINKKRLITIVTAIVILIVSCCTGCDTTNDIVDDSDNSPIVANIVRIPDLKGTDEESAKKIILDKQLIPIVEYEYDSSVREGIVIRSNPVEGINVKTDSRVILYVSKNYNDSTQSPSGIPITVSTEASTIATTIAKSTQTPRPSVTPISEPTATHTPELFRPLEVKEYGYSVNNGYLYYSVCIYNPNESYYVTLPTFRITARDADNILLGTKDKTLFSIYPQEEVWYAFYGFEVDEPPAKVTIEALTPKDYYIKEVSSVQQPQYIPLTVINYTKRGEKIVGEIKNDNDYEISQAILTVVFRDKDGKLLGGDSTFLESIPANGTVPFEKSAYLAFSDTFELYAGRWD